MTRFSFALVLLLAGGCTGDPVGYIPCGYAGECFDEPQAASFAPVRVPEIEVAELPPLAALSKQAQALNEYRQALGLKPVKENPQLTAAAQAHAIESSGRDYVGHFGADGSDPVDRIHRFGYRAAELGENAHGGSLTFKEALAAFHDSPPHRETLRMPNATEFGVGFEYNAASGHRWFHVLLMAEPE